MIKRENSLIVIFIFAVIIGGAILIWQDLSSSGALILEELRLRKKAIETLDEAALAAWKTYQREGFKFELKYPESLVYKYDSVWQPDDESSPIKKTLNAAFEGESFDMTLVVNAPNAQATSSKAEFLRQKTVSVGGQSVQNKIFREPNGDIISLAIFERNSNFYLLWATIVGDKDANLKVFSQILSTFRFLE